MSRVQPWAGVVLGVAVVGLFWWAVAGRTSLDAWQLVALPAAAAGIAIAFRSRRGSLVFLLAVLVGAAAGAAGEAWLHLVRASAHLAQQHRAAVQASEDARLRAALVEHVAKAGVPEANAEPQADAPPAADDAPGGEEAPVAERDDRDGRDAAPAPGGGPAAEDASVAEPDDGEGRDAVAVDRPTPRREMGGPLSEGDEKPVAVEPSVLWTLYRLEVRKQPWRPVLAVTLGMAAALLAVFQVPTGPEQRPQAESSE